MYFFPFYKLCYYPCRACISLQGIDRKSYNPSVFPACLYQAFWLEWNFISFHWIELGHLASPWNLSFFSHSLMIPLTLSNNFPTSLSTLPSHEPHLTQQPPLPVQIKTLYSQSPQSFFSPLYLQDQGVPQDTRGYYNSLCLCSLIILTLSLKKKKSKLFRHIKYSFVSSVSLLYLPMMWIHQTSASIINLSYWITILVIRISHHLIKQWAACNFLWRFPLCCSMSKIKRHFCFLCPRSCLPIH